jgi:hypothetical protein
MEMQFITKPTNLHVFSSVSMPCMVPTEMYYLVCGRHDSGRMIDRITKSVSVTIKSVSSNSIHG